MVIINISGFHHILLVNHETVLYSDHKVIFRFNLGYMFPDTDGHGASDTAARMF